jgi:peptide/nickel transport system substrate-binding protein
MATSDLAERTRLSQEAQRIVIEQAPWAFLYARDMLIGAQSDITGVTHSNDANLRFDRLRKGR